MPRLQSKRLSLSSETMTMTSPTIPTPTTNEETIARTSHGVEAPSRLLMELSKTEMLLCNADMDASRAEAFWGAAEARVAK